jgi:hypothetical protein
MNRCASALRLITPILFVLTSCSSLPLQNGVSPTSSISTSSVTQTPEIQPPTNTAGSPVEHRIGVRPVNDVGEFYDKQTNQKFIPRGANYVFVPEGNGQTLYLLREDTYDPQRTRRDFATLAGLGYNMVRVFLDHCNQGPGCIGDDDNIGLNPDYLNNIADMMLAGRETGIYVLFTSNDLPDQGGYAEEANSGSGGTFAGYRNSYYLRPQAVAATRRYWRDLLTGLRERNAAFDAVLGWQLLNEQWMFRDQPPLSLTSGMVETTTGTYNMSDADQKTQMVSDGIVYYIAQIKEEILSHDPTALVTMGFFAPDIAAPDWYVETASLLEKSDLDFFDFHAYPGGPSLQEHVEHFGMLGHATRPILLGEYGAFRHLYLDIDSAARALTKWVAESCQYGFDGWSYWTFYPADASAGDQTWGLVDEENYLLNLFAPRNQPDPCVALEIPNDNLAYGKPVTASRSLPEEPPENVVDDNTGTQWNSGQGPTQWIQVDLQGSYRITRIQLLVAQSPAGLTIHLVQVRASEADAFQTVHEFGVATADNDWLIFTPETPLEDVSQIRIETPGGPSWVAWKEIQVYGEAITP